MHILGCLTRYIGILYFVIIVIILGCLTRYIGILDFVIIVIIVGCLTTCRYIGYWTLWSLWLFWGSGDLGFFYKNIHGYWFISQESIQSLLLSTSIWCRVWLLLIPITWIIMRMHTCTCINWTTNLGLTFRRYFHGWLYACEHPQKRWIIIIKSVSDHRLCVHTAIFLP